MSTYEERQELMQMAKDVQHELSALAKRVHLLICKIIGEADSIMLKAFDEKSAEQTTIVKKVVQKLPQEEMPLDVPTTGRKCSTCREAGHQARNCPNAHKVKAEKEAATNARDERAERKAALKGTGKRACSNCHKPGHRAKNCPEPVVVKKRRVI